MKPGQADRAGSETFAPGKAEHRIYNRNSYNTGKTRPMTEGAE
jgi:hypothetical protein